MAYERGLQYENAPEAQPPAVWAREERAGVYYLPPARLLAPRVVEGVSGCCRGVWFSAWEHVARTLRLAQRCVYGMMREAILCTPL